MARDMGGMSFSVCIRAKGLKSPNTYNEQNLYNLYRRAFVWAGFSAWMKVHLPRHLLGYKQEKTGVDGADTSKLGWVRVVTYFDTYAPALPKKAILGAAGFKVKETYDPVWTRVHVLQQLLSPFARKPRVFGIERICLELSTTGRWLSTCTPPDFSCDIPKMPQICPLPAFRNPDVRNWMESTFPSELSLLQAKEGNPADLFLVQNTVFRKTLEDLYRMANVGDTKFTKLMELLERRTVVLSPVQGFSIATDEPDLRCRFPGSQHVCNLLSKQKLVIFATCNRLQNTHCDSTPSKHGKSKNPCDVRLISENSLL
ncbi:hypothetical protein B0H13DRAFT_2440063 [Mycena leptocephala]|nr:hypothetical protein B0H13DRAFT_2440063 [Mycena leptocephala]